MEMKPALQKIELQRGGDRFLNSVQSAGGQRETLKPVDLVQFLSNFFGSPNLFKATTKNERDKNEY